MSRRAHRKAIRRMMANAEVMQRRFNKAVDRGDRWQKSRANMARPDWWFMPDHFEGSGLIHKGRKP